MSVPHRSIGIAAALACLVVTSAPFGGSVAQAASAPAGGCADVEIMVNRGTSEPGTVGSMSVVADAITKGTAKTVTTWGNPYPASFSFATSTPQGVTDLSQQLTSQSAACPAQKFVLLGYSQGAIVVGDVLGGGSFTASPPISAAIGAKVAAAVMWGDPRFNSAEPFDAGTFKAGINGTFARTTGALKSFNPQLQDFCLAADGVCQGNGTLNINAGHLSYPTNNAAIQAASSFALARIGAAASTPPTKTTPPTRTTPPTPAGTPAAAVPAKHHKPWWAFSF